MEKWVSVEGLGCTGTLGSDEIRGSARCLTEFLCDQESRVPSAPWSVPEEVAWPPGREGATNTAVCAGQGQGGGREVGWGTLELHNKSVVSHQLAW